MDDYSYNYTFQGRSTELADIAALDRLAGDLAPASAMRRYASSRTSTGGPSWWKTLTARLRSTAPADVDGRREAIQPRVSDHLPFRA